MTHRNNSLLLHIFLICFFPSVLLAQEIKFTDVTNIASIGLPNTLSESLAWGDYDNDGDEDLYITNKGENRLYRNDGNDIFTDVTDIAGVGGDLFSVGTAFGDLDNDGDLELYVVNFEKGKDNLYRNDGPNEDGHYTFTDITLDAGVTIDRSSRGISFIDFDLDGMLDIYINGIGEDIFYHNDGDLKFTEVGSQVGMDNTLGAGVGVVATDCNNDGWPDIYNGNRSNDLSNLFINNKGVFVDHAVQAGIDASGLGMGVLSFDYDNDLDMDLYWTTWPGDSAEPVKNRLYENQGNGTSFIDMAPETGTEDALGWGISCNAGDIDNDGWMDFFVTNGADSSSTANVLFHNLNGEKFEDITTVLGGADWDGRGVAFADYDNDGDLDICLTGGPNHETKLWRNDTELNRHWIKIKLIGEASNKSAIGARVEVSTRSMKTVQEVSGGAGRGSFNSLPLEFGLDGAEMIDIITVHWPSGAIQNISNVSADQAITINESDVVTGIREEFVNKEQFKVSPNPFSGILNITYQIDKKAKTAITIIDITGREYVIKEAGIQQPGKYSIHFFDQDVQLPKGVYFVRLKVGDDQDYTRIIKD